MSTDDPQSPIQLFERLRQAGFDRKPILKAIIEKLGQKTLYEYVQGYHEVDIHPGMSERVKEFAAALQEETADLLGPQAAAELPAQLPAHYFVSTNDHHGPLNSHEFFNAHVVTALRAVEASQKLYKRVLVLPCAGISLNNNSFPRGLTFHAVGDKGTTVQRLSFFPSNAHASPLYNCRPYGIADLDKVKRLLRDKVKNGEVRQTVADKVLSIVDETFGAEDVLHSPDFSAQITRGNTKMWDKAFSTLPGAPSLLYLEQEWLVARLINKYHLSSNSVINRMIFDKEFDVLLPKFFDKIYGAFSLAEKIGTYLFWALPYGQNTRLQLWKQGNELVSDDGSYRIALTPEAIGEALEKKELMPGLLLTFTILSLYYGVKCLGGFSQINYLTLMKEGFIALQKEIGEPENAAMCEPVSTKNWSGFSYSFLGDASGAIMPALFFDFCLYGDAQVWKRLTDLSKRVTLEQALNPMLPEVYRYSYGEKERDPALFAMTESQIAKLTNMEPCLILS